MPDLWGNETGQLLRASMRDFDLPPACGVCEWHVRNDAIASADLVGYEALSVHDLAPQWPQRLEFSLSNRCNLECIHCSGELSSRIRRHREHLPPLPRVYGEQFFEDLDPFLEHLTDATFLGGEPFLQPECFRIWDRLIAIGRPVRCAITTSGVVYNDRVARVLDELPVRLSVSLDGAHPDTIESVRTGARWTDLAANIERFKDHLAPSGSLLFTFSLLTLNWREFPDFLLLAEEHGAEVWLNRVTHPAHLSLRSLGPDELAEGLAELEGRSDGLVPRLRRTEAVWWQMLATIRGYQREGGLRELGQLLEGSSPVPTELQVVRDGWASLAAGRWQEALEVSVPPSAGATVRYDLARLHATAYRLSGDHDRSMACIEECIALYPTRALAYCERALCHLSSGALDDAETDLEHALRLTAPGDDLKALVDATTQVVAARAASDPLRAASLVGQLVESHRGAISATDRARLADALRGVLPSDPASRR